MKNQTAIGGIDRQIKDDLKRVAKAMSPSPKLGSLAGHILAAWLEQHYKEENKKNESVCNNN